MQLKYFGSKAWLAPHMDRLLGDVAVLHSPFFEHLQHVPNMHCIAHIVHFKPRTE